jgi:Flp pilus assembly protein TadD
LTRRSVFRKGVTSERAKEPLNPAIVENVFNVFMEMEMQDTIMDAKQGTLENQLVEVKKMGPNKPRGLTTVWALLLLPTALGGAGLTVWKMRADVPEKIAVQKLREERDQALKAEVEAKKQLEKVVAARLALEKERDQALAREKAARHSESVAREVLSFLQDKLLLATGNPSSWSGAGLGQDVTLRKAVDAAEAQVAKAFVDKPLVEASVREILGAAYLELGQSEKAVQQYERALALREAELGPDHPATGECRTQLAVAYRRAGRTEDASRLFDLNPLKRKPNPAHGRRPHPQDVFLQQREWRGS